MTQAPTTEPMSRADRRRQGRNIAKAITQQPVTGNAPETIPCPNCKATVKRQRFDTTEMAKLLWHRIAPYGFMYTCPLCTWRGHIVEGMNQVDDAWIATQLQIAQGAEVELCVFAKTSPNAEPQKVWTSTYNPQQRPSGLVVAR